MKNVSLQVLLSTMNLVNPKEYIKSMNIKSDYVIINQVTNKKIKLVNEHDGKKTIISLNDVGLSKSRNMAIKNSSALIGLLSDDDVVYNTDYEKIIKSAYLRHQDADIIAFAIESDTTNKYNKIKKEGKLGFLKSFKISSIQLTFNLEKIKDKKLQFDEDFGAGSTNYMGEENIFLTDCFRSRLKIYYVPIVIGKLENLHPSTWFNGFDEKYFNVKGAVFYRMSKLLSSLLILQFAIRKISLYKNDVSLLNAVKFMFAGKKQYQMNKK